MKNVKKFAAVAIVFVVLGAGNAFANYPVIDIANLTEAIEQVYQQYMDIQQMIQSVQNQYVQIKHAVEAVKNFNFDKFKAFADPETWENPETIRNAYKAALSQANAFANTIHNVKDQFDAKYVRIGNQKFSYADILGIGKDEDVNGGTIVASMAKNSVDRAKKIGSAYAGQLTYEERRAIMQKYGVSPRNYAETIAAENVIEEIGHAMVSQGPDAEVLLSDEYKKARKEELEAKRQNALGVVEEMGKTAPESTIARQDFQNTLLADVGHTLGTIDNSLQQLSAQLEENKKREKEKEEKDAEKKRKEREAARNYRRAMRGINYNPDIL